VYRFVQTSVADVEVRGKSGGFTMALWSTSFPPQPSILCCPHQQDSCNWVYHLPGLYEATLVAWGHEVSGSRVVRQGSSSFHSAVEPLIKDLLDYTD